MSCQDFGKHLEIVGWNQLILNALGAHFRCNLDFINYNRGSYSAFTLAWRNRGSSSNFERWGSYVVQLSENTQRTWGWKRPSGQHWYHAGWIPWTPSICLSHGYRCGSRKFVHHWNSFVMLPWIKETPVFSIKTSVLSIFYELGWYSIGEFILDYEVMLQIT